jgi:hypothetical protein
MSETTFVWVEQEKGPLPPVGGVCSTRFVCSWGGHEARVVYLPGTPGHYPGYYFEIDGQYRGGARTAADARREAEEALRDLVLAERPTPGPWGIRPGTPPPLLSIHGPDGSIVASLFSGPANARLIAAAPELLAALEKLLRETQPCGETTFLAARDGHPMNLHHPHQFTACLAEALTGLGLEGCGRPRPTTPYCWVALADNPAVRLNLRHEPGRAAGPAA